MEYAKHIARIILGVIAIAIGVSLFFEIMNMRGYLGQVGVVGAITFAGAVMIAGLIVPPMIVGGHTLFLRTRCNAGINDKTHRLIAGIQFISIVTHLYTSFVESGDISLGFIVAMIVIGAVSLFVIRTAPGGIDVAPAANAAHTHG